MVPLRHVVHEKESLGCFHSVQSLFTKLFLSRCEQKERLFRPGRASVEALQAVNSTCIEEGQAICREWGGVHSVFIF